MRVLLAELEAVVGPWAMGHGFSVRLRDAAGDAEEGARIWVELGSHTLEVFALDGVGNVAVEFVHAATRKRYAYGGPIPDLGRLLDEALLAAQGAEPLSVLN